MKPQLQNTIDIDDITNTVIRVYEEYKDASTLKMCHMISCNVFKEFIEPLINTINTRSKKATCIGGSYHNYDISNQGYCNECGGIYKQK